jgi:hypothetical protein
VFDIPISTTMEEGEIRDGGKGVFEFGQFWVIEMVGSVAEGIDFHFFEVYMMRGKGGGSHSLGRSARRLSSAILITIPPCE